MTGCIFFLLLVVLSFQSSDSTEDCIICNDVCCDVGEVYIPCTPSPTGESCPVGYHCCGPFGCWKDGSVCPPAPVNTTSEELIPCDNGTCPPNSSCCENECCPSNCHCGCWGCWCHGLGPVCPVNAPSCHVLKTVGDICYEREEDNVDTSSYGCTTNCTYKKIQNDGSEDERFCFAPGVFPVNNYKCQNLETDEPGFTEPENYVTCSNCPTCKLENVSTSLSWPPPKCPSGMKCCTGCFPECGCCIPENTECRPGCNGSCGTWNCGLTAVASLIGNHCGGNCAEDYDCGPSCPNCLLIGDSGRCVNNSGNQCGGNCAEDFHCGPSCPVCVVLNGASGYCANNSETLAGPPPHPCTFCQKVRHGDACPIDGGTVNCQNQQNVNCCTGSDDCAEWLCTSNPGQPLEWVCQRDCPSDP